MGSYSSAKGIKTSPAENPLGTGSLRPAATCSGVSTICRSSEEPPRFRSITGASTLFCPLALGLSESCLLHLELRLQEFEVFGPAFCFWVTSLHSQVVVQRHLLRSVLALPANAPGPAPDGNRNWCFWAVWCWRRLLRVPWTSRRLNQSILKEINPEYSLGGLTLKLQYIGYLMWRTDSLERPWCWERL